MTAGRRGGRRGGEEAVAAGAGAGTAVRALRGAVTGVQKYAHYWHTSPRHRFLASWSKFLCAALISFILHCRPGGVEGVLARTHQWRTQPDARWGKLDRPGRNLSLALLVTEDIH